MNTKTLIGAAVTLIVGVATASVVRAFDVAGDLGANENATDVFTINCPLGTNSVKAWVWDLVDPVPVNIAARMRVFLVKFPNKLSLHKEDTAPNPPGTGEGGGSSPNASLGDGAGLYQVNFYKTAAGAESYNGQILCLNVNGGDVGVNAPLQTQQQ